MVLGVYSYEFIGYKNRIIGIIRKCLNLALGNCLCRLTGYRLVKIYYIGNGAAVFVCSRLNYGGCAYSRKFGEFCFIGIDIRLVYTRVFKLAEIKRLAVIGSKPLACSGSVGILYAAYRYGIGLIAYIAYIIGICDYAYLLTGVFKLKGVVLRAVIAYDFFKLIYCGKCEFLALICTMAPYCLVSVCLVA